MAAINEANVHRKFANVNNTQDSIQSLSLWVLHHKSHSEKIVGYWFKVLKKSKITHRLTMLYLCNDIVQTCKRRHAIMYKDAFKEVLKDAILLVRDQSIRTNVERILNIWEQRKVYDADYIEEMKALLNNTRTSSTLNSKLLAEFQPSTVMNKLVSFKKLEKEVDIKKRRVDTFRFDASNIAAIKEIKDRAHGKEYSQNFEDSCLKLEDCIASVEKEIKERTALIELLEESEVFYDAQFGEAKIVANAYKNFGQRVTNQKKKIEDCKNNLPSPAPSPCADAPSPGSTPLHVTQQYDNTDTVDMDMSDEESDRKGKKGRKRLYDPSIPQMAVGAKSSFMKGGLEGDSTPTKDERSMTPVLDEADGANPIDFLAQLLSQTKKDKKSGGDLLKSLSVLSNTIKENMVDKKDDDKSTGGGSWAAWKAQKEASSTPPPIVTPPPPPKSPNKKAKDIKSPIPGSIQAPIAMLPQVDTNVGMQNPMNAGIHQPILNIIPPPPMQPPPIPMTLQQGVMSNNMVSNSQQLGYTQMINKQELHSMPLPPRPPMLSPRQSIPSPHPPVPLRMPNNQGRHEQPDMRPRPEMQLQMPQQNMPPRLLQHGPPGMPPFQHNPNMNLPPPSPPVQRMPFQPNMQRPFLQARIPVNLPPPPPPHNVNPPPRNMPPRPNLMPSMVSHRGPAPTSNASDGHFPGSAPGMNTPPPGWVNPQVPYQGASPNANVHGMAKQPISPQQGSSPNPFDANDPRGRVFANQPSKMRHANSQGPELAYNAKESAKNAKSNSNNSNISAANRRTSESAGLLDATEEFIANLKRKTAPSPGSITDSIDGQKPTILAAKSPAEDSNIGAQSPREPASDVTEASQPEFTRDRSPVSTKVQKVPIKSTYKDLTPEDLPPRPPAPRRIDPGDEIFERPESFKRQSDSYRRRDHERYDREPHQRYDNRHDRERTYEDYSHQPPQKRFILPPPPPRSYPRY